MRLKTPPSKNKSIQKAYQNSTNRYTFIITFVCVVIVCDQWPAISPNYDYWMCDERSAYFELGRFMATQLHTPVQFSPKPKLPITIFNKHTSTYARQ